MKRININKFNDLLRSIFKDTDWNIIEKKGLSPISIYILSASKKNWEDIPNWSKFEKNNYYYDNKEEDVLFLGELKTGNSILISDTTLIKNECVYFNLDNFQEFKNEYSTLYNCEFFQPEDYILYFIEDNSFSLIHNSGKCIKIKLKDFQPEFNMKDIF